ncbi:MAG: DUF1329 domain-containing protein [Deltaproteobacteria bacterium]|nr:DUF1329 domain-containing protein [Deltaproteobacteria bacterium]
MLAVPEPAVEEPAQVAAAAAPDVHRPAAPVRAPQPAPQAAVPIDEPADSAGDGGAPSLEQYGLAAGQVISEKNASQFTELLVPGIDWGVRYGWRLELVDYKPIKMPKRFREATEKHAGQVRLGPGALTVENYVAGLPFPRVDANDPDAAAKVMWNFYYNGFLTDDKVMSGVDTYSGSVGPHEPIRTERHLLTDVYRRLNYNGRLYVDPKPEMPNPEGVRYKESLHPILEPFDLKGVGATFYRYLDPGRQDDNWLYLPQLRRVRRLSTAQRSDALFGQDVDSDSFAGYNGHIGWMSYRLLGERTILATMHARNFPPKWQNPEDWLYEDVWEPRRVWVIEATPKMSQYAYGKRVLYVDQEAWVIAISDSYDRAGQLWKTAVNMYTAKREAIPGDARVQYEDEMLFFNADIYYDVQLQHATATANPRFAGTEKGYFINVGARMGVTEDYFTVAHMIEKGG